MIFHPLRHELVERLLELLERPAKVAVTELRRKDKVASVKKLLAKGPLVVCMPNHFVCIHGIVDGKLLIVDPGGVLSYYWAIAGEGGKTAISTGKGRPDKNTGWRGSPAPDDEYKGTGYVSIPLDAKIYVPEPDPSDTKRYNYWSSDNKKNYQTPDKAKRFLDTISKPQSFWWAGGE